MQVGFILWFIVETFRQPGPDNVICMLTAHHHLWPKTKQHGLSKSEKSPGFVSQNLNSLTTTKN